MIYTKLNSIIYILLLLLSFDVVVIGQNQNLVEEVSRTLNQALINQNEVQLDSLLHPDLSYGHSNGWMENKQELLDHNHSKFLVYQTISMDSVQSRVFNDFAIIRYQSNMDVIMNHNPIHLKLHVCQTWMKSNGKWKLVARQSTKI